MRRRIVKTALVLWVACLGGPLGAEEPVDRTPWPRSVPWLTVPPALVERVIYFNSFTDGPDTPEMNDAGAKPLGKVQGKVVQDGFSGKGLRLGARETYTADSPRFRPDKPITVSMWWRLEDAMPHNSGASFFRLTNRGRGYISVFSRGGPWCALKDTALVLQVYNFKGLRDVNAILNRRFRQTVQLDDATWHHLVLTASMGSRIKLFLDGKRVALVNLKGRTLDQSDALNTLHLGSYGRGMVIDDLMVLDVSLSDKQVSDFYNSMTGLREIGYLD